MTREEKLASLRRRYVVCRDMVTVYIENDDPHGVMDMGAEMQALRIAILAVEAVTDTAELT